VKKFSYGLNLIIQFAKRRWIEFYGDSYDDLSAKVGMMNKQHQFEVLSQGFIDSHCLGSREEELLISV